MELLLNLGWVLLALAAFRFWRPHRWRLEYGRKRARVLIGVVALGIALLVLFPSISVTDDLHAEQAVMEDSAAKLLKRSANGQASSSSCRLIHHAAGPVAPGWPLFRSAVVGRIVLASILCSSVAAAARTAPRAPPSLL